MCGKHNRIDLNLRTLYRVGDRSRPDLCREVAEECRSIVQRELSADCLEMRTDDLGEERLPHSGPHRLRPVDLQFRPPSAHDGFIERDQRFDNTVPGPARPEHVW